MSSEVKLSIIIPVYNTERYLSRCLDSIIQDAYNNIEIICIDDGSEDNSLGVLQDYNERDERIVLKHLEINHGQSYARNIGIKHARGKYIWFVDSDDSIIPDSMEHIVQMMEKDNLDCLLFDCEYYRGDTGIYYDNIREGKYDGIHSGYDIINNLLKNDEFDVSPCRQCWKKKYIVSNNLYFYNGIIYEDILFSFKAILNAQRIECINESFYKYYRRFGSTTTNEYDYKYSVRSYVIIYSECKKIFDNGLAYYENSMEIIRFLNSVKSNIIRLEMSALKNNIDLDTIFYENAYHKKIQNEVFIIGKISLKYLYNKLKGYQYHDIMVYGGGEICRQTIIALDLIGVNNYKIVVSNHTDQKIMGNRVICIEDIEESCLVCFIIAVRRKIQNEIISVLNQRGFKNYILAY